MSHSWLRQPFLQVLFLQVTGMPHNLASDLLVMHGKEVWEADCAFFLGNDGLVGT